MSFTLLLLVSKLAIAFPTKASTFILQLNLLKLSLGSIALITYSLSLVLIYPSSSSKFIFSSEIERENSSKSSPLSTYSIFKSLV